MKHIVVCCVSREHTALLLQGNSLTAFIQLAYFIYIIDCIETLQGLKFLAVF